MNDTESKQLLLAIIEQAQKGESLEFCYIKSWSDFRFRKQQAYSTRIIIKTLKASSNNLFKEYCQDVLVGISDINKLLAYSQLCDIIAFYENDLAILQQMLDDYDEYLGTGYFWYSLLGGKRVI